MNTLLERIYETGTILTADGQRLQATPPGVPRQLAATLYRLVRENRIHQTLEVGMAFGLSSLAICQALQDNGGGHHIAVDPLQTTTYKSVGLLNLDRSGLADLATLHEQPSHLVLPYLLRQGQKFGLIFIDGSHLFDFVMVDFFYAQRLIPIGGWICMDDTTFIQPVTTAFTFITRNLDHIEITEVTQQYCVLKKIAEDRRPWNHFKPF